MNCLPFPVKSYIGFSNFCNSGQTLLRKFTIPVKLLHPFAVVGGCNFCIASNLFLKGLTQTLQSFMKTELPIYCNSVLRNWLSFRDILSLFFSNALSKSSNFAMCDFFDGVNYKKSSIIASHYVLLCKQSNVAFM